MHLNKPVNSFWPYLAMFAIASLLLYFKHDYLFSRFIFIMGLIFFPFIVRSRAGKKSLRYGVLSLLAGVVLIFENGNMAYYFCAGFSILFLWEYHKGQLNNLPFFLLAIISPVFQYISEVWSFPFRLALSKWAGMVLSVMGKEVDVAGNMVMLDGNEFAVDPACMGLNMLSVSLLLSLVLMARLERLKQFTFSYLEIGCWMLFVLLLSVFSNFNRLLSLVLFRVLPENPMHDIWGLIALFVMVLAPVYYLLEWRVRNTKNKSKNRAMFIKDISFSHVGKLYVPHLFTAAIFSILLLNGNSKEKELIINLQSIDHITSPGFTKSITPDGMLKMEKDSVLLYVKPPAGFLRASHDPRICWRGSGFEFKQIKRETIGGLEVYTARMEKGKEYLYTAWWYDNGHLQTVEEWIWRWNSLLGEDGKFYLINITCATKMELEHALREVVLVLDF